MPGVIATIPKYQFSSATGAPLASGTLTTYLAGTTTLATTYQDQALTIANTNPIMLDARGECVLWLDSALNYKFVLRNSAAVVQWTQDNISNPAALVAALSTSLAASSGAALVGFVQAGANASPRTLQDKSRDIVDAFDFMTAAQIASVKAKDFTQDVLGAVQNAVASLPNGGQVMLFAGGFKFSGALTTPYPGVSIRGRNKFTTEIRQFTLNSPTFDVTADHFEWSNLKITYSGTPAIGGDAIRVGGSWCQGHEFWIDGCYNGVSFAPNVGSATGCRMWELDIRSYVASGILANGINDLYVHHFILDANNATNGSLGGIRLLNKAEAVLFSHGSVLNGVFSITTDASTYAQGVRPAYCHFSDMFCDTSAKGSSLDKLVESSFTDTWFSGGRSGAGFPGLNILQCESLIFTHPHFFNCGGHGCQISGSVKNIHFIAPSVNSNSVTAGAGVRHGLYFDVNASDWSVTGGCSTNGLYTGTQGVGLFISAGCANYNVTALNVRGNLTAGILDGAGAATGFISKCPGYMTENKATGTIVVGQSLTVITHGLAGQPAAHEINLGFASSPASSGVNSLYVAAITSTTFQLVSNAVVSGGNLSVTWSANIKGA